MSNAPWSAEAMSAAGGLLAPLKPEAFLADAYRRRAVLAPGGAGDRFDRMLTLGEVESYLRVPAFYRSASVAMRRPGADEADFVGDPATVFERLSKGDALQIIGLNRVLPDRHPLIRAFRALEELCQAPGEGVSVFVAPPGAALPRHDDPFEIFTLQIVGRKTWRLYEAGAADDAAAPSQSIELGPGDLLYTPKGLVHHVLPSAEISLSAALVYAPMTWMRLLDALGAAVAGDPAFDEALPPTDIAGGFEARRDALAAALQAMDGAEFAARVTADRRAAIPGLPGDHLATSLRADDIDVGTVLRARPGPAPVVKDTSDGPMLVSAFDTPIRGPRSAAEAFRFIAGRSAPFRVADLPGGLSDASKTAIARKLARRGILQIVDGPAASSGGAVERPASA